MHPPRWSLATGILVGLASGQQCYWPNGNDASLVACPVANGTAAACCFAGHYCMSNGVCFSNTELSFYRGACTAKDWSTSGCPTYCDKEDVAGAVRGAHAGIAKCTNKQYACQSTSNCATDSFEVPAGNMLPNLYLKSDIGVIATASTASTAGTAPATATGTAATSVGDGAGGATEATCTSTPADAAASSGISTGAAAGIGVGVGAPLALAVGLLTVLLLREKKKTRQALSRPVYSEIAPTSPWAKSEHTTYAPVEIPTQAPPPELPSDHRGRHELS
ncbi:uncharacterized protein LY79DRAFT_538953 [Colletotrichum navitas]|uniref:Uncharacterized protein n=1 Tax=Colletotrichum navitas TaxID=681940 RepID=A0AAD8VAX4_9PEZI|nr:uncharacterized protein LY79DRAFT_538953 [Colletotrichum navitas]KAK1598356.1 hypothetical protein LY79DRAFT_538953 [Colletotrichum navitas]